MSEWKRTIPDPVKITLYGDYYLDGEAVLPNGESIRFENGKHIYSYGAIELKIPDKVMAKHDCPRVWCFNRVLIGSLLSADTGRSQSLPREIPVLDPASATSVFREKVLSDELELRCEELPHG